MSVDSRTAPGSPGALRSANQQRVLDELLRRRGKAATQADLGRATGLAAGTVSSIVRELSAADIVDTEPGSGRRGTTVRLGRGAGLVAGLDFGHSHLRVAVADMSGTLLAHRRADLASDHAHTAGLDLAQSLLVDCLDEAGASPDDLRSIGMGLPAPTHDDVVQSSAILPGWVGVNAREAAAAYLGRPVLIDNDANLGALAEHRYGAGIDHRTIVFVKVSSGVGAGLIINDQLFRGADGTAGEIGHLTLDEQGPLCRCGSRGCLEAYAASGTARDMMALQMPGARLSDIVTAAQDGNVAALRVFEDAGLHLGWGLAALTNLLNPDLIVVGGDMAAAGDLLLDPARLGLRRHVLAAAAHTPIVTGSLGDRASVMGALALAIDHTDLLAPEA